MPLSRGLGGAENLDFQQAASSSIIQNKQAHWKPNTHVARVMVGNWSGVKYLLVRALL